MSDTTDTARNTQLSNIAAKTGRSIDVLLATIGTWELDKHARILARAKTEFGIGHGDANLLAHLYRQRLAPPDASAVADPVGSALERIYSGSKAQLRALHDSVMRRIASLGPYQIAPKKTYLSLRRRRQFATVGPGSRGRIEIGLNLRNEPAEGRLEALPPGGMCSHRLFVARPEDLDDEVFDHVRRAYHATG
jgi:hypothetical protein